MSAVYSEFPVTTELGIALAYLGISVAIRGLTGKSAGGFVFDA
jgi:hypothetical protein